jgi:hypothetical protein
MSQKECMAYYQGQFSQIQVVSEMGKTIRLDAQKLRPFVSSLGIKGRFKLILSLEHKFISLEKVS